MSDELRGRRTSSETALRILRLISRIEDGILVALLSGMILVAATQILLRNVFDRGLSWGDPLLRVLVLWLALMGAVAASRDNKHINVDIFMRFLAQRSKAMAQAGIGLFTALVSAIVTYHAVRFVYLDYEAGTRAFSVVPIWIVELVLPFGFGLISINYLILSVANLKRYRIPEDGS